MPITRYSREKLLSWKMMPSKYLKNAIVSIWTKEDKFTIIATPSKTLKLT